MNDEHKEDISRGARTNQQTSVPGTDEDVRSQQAKDAEGQENDDISFEELNEEGEVDTRTTVKKLREKIKKLEAEKQEYLDLSVRTRADYANFKKEVDANRLTDRKFSTKRFIEELIPVLDSYDMAQANKEAWESVDKNWRAGVEYIFGQLRTVLEGEGVKQFGKIGDTFDPLLHESMEHVLVENESDNDKVVRVLQNGYTMHDTVLRPARVHTGQYEKKGE